MNLQNFSWFIIYPNFGASLAAIITWDTNSPFIWWGAAAGLAYASFLLYRRKIRQNSPEQAAIGADNTGS